MHGGSDGVEEALIGVRSKIDGEGGLGSDGAGDFDVQHDFAIRAVGVARGFVVGAVDGDSDYFWRSHVEGVLEIGLNVLGFEAAAQFNNSYPLAIALSIRSSNAETRTPGWRERSGA